MQKWVYTFGDGRAEGQGGMKNLLGGKGANLAEMSHLVDQFQFQQPEQVAGMIDAALRALARHLVVLAQDRRQLQLLEVVPEKNLERAGPGAARHGAVDRGRHAAISGTSAA